MSGAPIRFAQRLAKNYSLTPPVDVRALLGNYADVVETQIPILGVDGICLNLKVPGKRPCVVINSDNPVLRKRFTEAHELGHIIIPWHRGTIVDHLDSGHTVDPDYWQFEEEANQFAAELLMPSTWLTELIESIKDLSLLHKTTCERCGVSALAAFRQLSARLPKNITFICQKDNEVEFSGKTDGTLANVPHWNTPFDAGLFVYATNHYVADLGARRLHWWVLPEKVNRTSNDPRSWRQILDAIVEEIGIEADDQHRFKMSVNGVLSAANSSVKRRSLNYSSELVIAAGLQRFGDREDFRSFFQHPNFMDFLIKRAAELAQ